MEYVILTQGGASIVQVSLCASEDRGWKGETAVSLGCGVEIPFLVKEKETFFNKLEVCGTNERGGRVQGR